MGPAAARQTMTAAAFLHWDASQSQRHEFVGGEVFAMAGAGDTHVTVAGNLYSALRRHLHGSPCRTFITDMKLQVEAADAYFYPDLMVTCSSVDAADPLVKREPKLLVEVLSPATAACDRGGKFAAYRCITTLQEYLLVDTDSRVCDLYRKGADGLRVLHPFLADQPVVLSSISLDLSPAVPWDEVPLPMQPASAR